MADETPVAVAAAPRDQDAAARFLPARTEYERPAVRLGDVLVFTYLDQDGTVRVTVDTEDAEGRPVDVRINVNGGTVFEGRVC